jgi:serine/threonine protein kinase/WD40 repeat protein
VADAATINLQQQTNKSVADAATINLQQQTNKSVADAATINLQQQTAKPSEIAAGIAFGRYQINKELGRGGMGIVYAAYDPDLDRVVALKVMGLTTSNAKQLARFERETHLMAKLNHPNIIKIFDMGQVEGRYFFTMELVTGESFSQWLRQKPSLSQLLPIFVKVVKAVHYAHKQGVIHRDLKPSNILLDKDGEPKVMDFGLAKEREGRGEKLSRTYDILGTPEYMSPEQAEGKSSQTDARSDVYALGIILYEMLAGKTPFAGAPMNILYQIISKDPAPLYLDHPNIPRDLEAICFKAIDKDKKKRYHSALVLAEDIVRYAEGLPVLARPVTSLVRAQKWVRRHRFLTASVLGVLVAISTIISLFMWQLRQEANKQSKLRKIAEKQTQIAVQETQIAVQATQKAETQKQIAQEQTRIAKREKINAILKEAESNLILAKTLIDKQSYMQARDWQSKAQLSLQDEVFKNLPAFSDPASINDLQQEKTEATRQYQILSQASTAMLRYCLLFFAPETKELQLGQANGNSDGFQHLVISFPSFPFKLLFTSQPSRRFVCAYQDKQIEIWDIAGNKKIKSFALKDSQVAAFSADQKWVAVGGRNEQLLLWDSQEDMLHQSPPIPASQQEVKFLRFSPDGKWLFVVYKDKSSLLAIPGLTPVLSLEEGGRNVRCAFSGDSKSVVVNSDRHLLASGFTFDENKKTFQKSRTFIGDTRSLCFGPGDKTLITGTVNDIRIYPLEARQGDMTLLGVHRGRVEHLQLSDDGRFLVSLGSDSRLVLWHTLNYREVMEIPISDMMQDCRLISLDSVRKEISLMASDRLHIYPWEAREIKKIEWLDRQEIAKGTRELRQSLNRSDLARNSGRAWVSLALSPDGNYLAFCLVPYIYLWDMTQDTITCSNISSMQNHSITFNSDGKWLIWNSPLQLRIFQIPDLKPIVSQKWEHHEEFCVPVALDKLVLYRHSKEQRKIQFCSIEKENLAVYHEIDGERERLPWMDVCVLDRSGKKLAAGKEAFVILDAASPTTEILFRGAVHGMDPIKAMCFSTHDCLALGGPHGNFTVYNWKMKKIVQQVNVREFIRKIWFDEHAQLYWIYTQNSLFVYPHLPEAGDQEAVKQIYPLPVCSGYPLVAVEVSQDFRKLFLVLQSGELLILPLAR